LTRRPTRCWRWGHRWSWSTSTHRARCTSLAPSNFCSLGGEMLWTYLIIAAVAVVVLLILFRTVWRVAEPNEALIISGLGAHSSSEQINETLGFKIVVGRGTAVLPGFQTVRRLPLDIRATPLT